MERILLLKKIKTAITMLMSDRAALYNKLGIGRESGSQKYSFLLDYTVNRYWKNSGLEKLFSEKDTESADFKLFITNHKKHDVVNLHRKIVVNQCKSVIEFGCGISTVVMAHAMLKNNEKYNIKGKIYSVEAHPKWADIVREKLIEVGLDDYTEVTSSKVRLSKLGGQTCHFFDKLPDVRPDLMYLDGPAPKDVEGNSNGVTMNGLHFVVAADPLLYEYSFYPGFQMVVDGRYNNVEFLKNNFKRKYRIKRDFVRNITTFSLKK
jgi:hypothetical protein